MQLVRQAVYLGINIGPEAHAHQRFAPKLKG